jgi:hypothetical protein
MSQTCGNCRERTAEHFLKWPTGFIAACSECWPDLEALVQALGSSTLVHCSCGSSS